jgi:hypothetical protein
VALDAPRHLLTPVEGEAEIISFEAQRSQTRDGGTPVAMAVSLADQEMLGRKVTFQSTREGFDALCRLIA